MGEAKKGGKDTGEHTVREGGTERRMRGSIAGKQPREEGAREGNHRTRGGRGEAGQDLPLAKALQGSSGACPAC